MKSFTDSSLSVEKVTKVEIFTRSSPPCDYCFRAKKWIEEHLPHVSVTEYNINIHTSEWWELLNKHPMARSTPQITITMENGTRQYIGGYPQLLEAFQAPPLQACERYSHQLPPKRA